nr:MAG TPA: hypothetical protein [Caudoviricetes sp.]
MFRLFECCALSFFERFVLSFSLKIERFVSDSAEIWICGLYHKVVLFFSVIKFFMSALNVQVNHTKVKILCHIEEDRIKDFMCHRRRCDCAYTQIPRHVADEVLTRSC